MKNFFIFTILLVCMFVSHPWQAFAEEDVCSESLSLLKYMHSVDTVTNREHLKLDDPLKIDTPTSDMILKHSSASLDTVKKSAIYQLILEDQRNYLMAYLNKGIKDTNYSIYLNNDTCSAVQDYLQMIDSHTQNIDFLQYMYPLRIVDYAIYGDIAKIIVHSDFYFQEQDMEDRSTAVTTASEYTGYILRRVGDTWKIDNIIFGGMGAFTDNLKVLQAANSAKGLEILTFDKNNLDVCEDLNNYTDHAPTMAHEQEIAYLNSPEYLAKVKKNKQLENNSFLKGYRPGVNGYLKANALKYAKKYYKNYNRAYPNYNNQGGDCTNFISQAIYAGGLDMDNIWWANKTSSSIAWQNAQQLREYLGRYTATEGYYQKLPPYPRGVNPLGTVVQFTNGKEWYHSAMVSRMRGGEIRTVQHTPSDIDRVPSRKMKDTRSLWIK